MTKDVNENDIVLGLKCVADDDEILCKDCAFNDNNRGFACRKNVSRAAINLINRLTAENLELQGNLKFVRGTVARLLETIDKQQAEIDQFADIGKMYSEVRAEAIVEAIKEFAELLKEKRGLYGEIWDEDIDNIVREMIDERSDNK